MKYTIDGFQQERVVALGLDHTDSRILRWFVDFMQTDRMIERLHPKEECSYYWVRYQAVIDDLPTIGIGTTEAIGRRFKKLCDAHVLKSWITKDERGTYTLFRIDKTGFSGMVGDDIPRAFETDTPPAFKTEDAPDPKSDPKDSSTKNNPSTKKNFNAEGASLPFGLEDTASIKSEPTPPESNKKPDLGPESLPYRLAKLLYTEHLKNDPGFLVGKDLDATFRRWGKDIEYLMRIDKRDEHTIARMIRWCQADAFWNSNILSGNTLREKYPKLLNQMDRGVKKSVLTPAEAKSLDEIAFRPFPRREEQA